MVIMFASEAQASGAALFGMAVAFACRLRPAINIVTLKRTGAHVDLAPVVLLGALLSCAITLPLSLPFVASTKDVLLLAIRYLPARHPVL